MDISTDKQAALLVPMQPVKLIAPKNGKDFTLEELYELIGCDMVEVVKLYNSSSIMIVDEAGKMKKLPINLIATDLFRMGRKSHKETIEELMNDPRYANFTIYDIDKIPDYIVGTVVICPKSMFK